MGKVIQLQEAAAALERGGLRTRFVYCPDPDAATRRAYRRACNQAIYTPEVILLAAIGAAGAAWIIGAGFWAALARAVR